MLGFSVISVGEGGYWEGKIGDREGWFPSEHVQEVRLRRAPGRNKHQCACPAVQSHLSRMECVYSSLCPYCFPGPEEKIGGMSSVRQFPKNYYQNV